MSSQREDHLFSEILVPINGLEDGWFALDQAIIIAIRENAGLHGLFVLEDNETVNSPLVENIQHEFDHRCLEAGIQHDLLIKNGDITAGICEQARWNDLVVINLTYPPEASALGRLISGIRNLIQRCPRPIIFTPQVSKSLDHALLVYDGSSNSQEALFIAAYLVNQWRIALEVIIIGDENNSASFQGLVQGYLEEQEIHAEYNLITRNHVPEVILAYLDKRNLDLLLMGGYSQSPVIEVLQGSSLDVILRQAHVPILVCR